MKWVENYSKTILYEKKPADFVMITDITDRKITEEALLESEGRYRMLIENMNDGLVVVDKNGLITFVNSKFCEIGGYNYEEVTQFI